MIDFPEKLTSYFPHLTRADASINDGGLQGISPIIETPGRGWLRIGAEDKWMGVLIGIGIPPMVVPCHKLYTFVILISVHRRIGSPPIRMLLVQIPSSLEGPRYDQASIQYDLTVNFILM